MEEILTAALLDLAFRSPKAETLTSWTARYNIQAYLSTTEVDEQPAALASKLKEMGYDLIKVNDAVMSLEDKLPQLCENCYMGGPKAMHTCPCNFKSGKSTLCYCCPSCEYDCWMDV